MLLCLLSLLSLAADGLLSSQVRDHALAAHATTGGTVVVIADDEKDLNAMRQAIGTQSWVRFALASPGGLEASVVASQAACGLHVRHVGPGSLWGVDESAGCTSKAPTPAPVATTVAPAAPVVPTAPVVSVAPAATAAPAPVVVPSLPPPVAAAPAPAGTWSDQRQLDLLLSAPSPATAMLMSTIVGFGSGHYYAGSKGSGTRHLAIQATAVVLAGIGSAVASSATDPAFGNLVYNTGLAALIVDRAVEVINAPFKAHQTTARMISTGSAHRYNASDTW
jgi:hypothetical protein